MARRRGFVVVTALVTAASLLCAVPRGGRELPRALQE
jgi:hypothetical protein